MCDTNHVKNSNLTKSFESMCFKPVEMIRSLIQAIIGVSEIMICESHIYLSFTYFACAIMVN